MKRKIYFKAKTITSYGLRTLFAKIVISAKIYMVRISCLIGSKHEARILPKFVTPRADPTGFRNHRWANEFRHSEPYFKQSWPLKTCKKRVNLEPIPFKVLNLEL